MKHVSVLWLGPLEELNTSNRGNLNGEGQRLIEGDTVPKSLLSSKFSEPLWQCDRAALFSFVQILTFLAYHPDNELLWSFSQDESPRAFGV